MNAHKLRRAIPALAVAGLSLSFAAKAHAVLQLGADVSGVSFTCADQQACDTNPAVGILALANGTIVNGLEVNGSLSTATQGPPLNILNSSSLSVINTALAPRTVDVVVSDTDFTPASFVFSVAGSGTFQNAVGAKITLDYWNDPANGQGGFDPPVHPGNLIHTFSFTSTKALNDAFSDVGAGALAFPDTGPFSMSLQFTFTLPAGTPGCAAAGTCPELLGRSQSEIKPVAEPASLALFGVGLLGAFCVSRRRPRH